MFLQCLTQFTLLHNLTLLPSVLDIRMIDCSKEWNNIRHRLLSSLSRLQYSENHMLFRLYSHSAGGVYSKAKVVISSTSTERHEHNRELATLLPWQPGEGKSRTQYSIEVINEANTLATQARVFEAVLFYTALIDTRWGASRWLTRRWISSGYYRQVPPWVQPVFASAFIFTLILFFFLPLASSRN